MMYDSSDWSSSIPQRIIAIPPVELQSFRLGIKSATLVPKFIIYHFRISRLPCCEIRPFTFPARCQPTDIAIYGTRSLGRAKTFLGIMSASAVSLSFLGGVLLVARDLVPLESPIRFLIGAPSYWRQLPINESRGHVNFDPERRRWTKLFVSFHEQQMILKEWLLRIQLVQSWLRRCCY